MKTSNIIKSLRDVLDHESGKKKKQKAALKKILAKLRKKEAKLKKKIEGADSDKARKALTAKLKVSRAHRKKGVAALRKLNGKG
ncbi:MAG: hypothetical protein QGH73_09695 [Rhodospirillales bacterium]|nr:hypothetical protein [Rhodospirillales bacterium]MDP6643937.1 hypothetical protein [Rhodospirillales bacterium]MDP6841938.1 hypothetical protein [Rhodospirillales bacterium]